MESQANTSFALLEIKKRKTNVELWPQGITVNCFKRFKGLKS